MKRRLLIAKALVHEPRVLFLDEPTAGVDVELRRALWRYVRTLRDRGTTVVLTTHYLEEAEELADRIGVIDRGRLLLVEEKEALLRRHGAKTLRLVLGAAARGGTRRRWRRWGPGWRRTGRPSRWRCRPAGPSARSWRPRPPPAWRCGTWRRGGPRSRTCSCSWSAAAVRAAAAGEDGVISLGLRTLFEKEVRRFLRVPGQTLLSPLITTTLYFLVFGYSLGGAAARDRGRALRALHRARAGDPGGGHRTPTSTRPRRSSS